MKWFVQDDAAVLLKNIYNLLKKLATLEQQHNQICYCALDRENQIGRTIEYFNHLVCFSVIL